MKKRLLSAALALAMVLTLLPVSAFALTTTGGEKSPQGATYPVVSGGVTTNVPFYNVDATHNTTVTVTRDTTSADGKTYGDWYWLDNKTDPQNPVYYKVTSGIIVGNNGSGLWYPDQAAFTTTTTTTFNGVPNQTVQSLRSSTLTLLGSTSLDMSSGNWATTTLNVDIEGSGTLTLAENATSVTVTSKFVNGTPTGNVAAITRNHSAYATTAPGNSALTLNATNVNVGAIDLTGRGNSVTLTNCVMTGGVEMDGTTQTTATTTSCTAQRFSATGCKISGAITITGDGSTVALASTTGATAATATGAVAIKGHGGSLTISGASNVGAVTAASRALTTTDTAVGNIPSVTVSGGKVASISTASDAGPGSANITLNRNTGSTNVGAVTVKKGAVSVAAGVTTAAITVPEGSLTIAGSAAANAAIGTGTTTGTLTLAANGVTTLSISGYGNDIAGISVDNGKGSNLDIRGWPTGRNNDFGTLALNDYAKKQIAGGTFDLSSSALPFTTDKEYKWINTTSLTYQAIVNSKAALYTKDELGQAIDDVNNGVTPTGTSPAATAGNIGVIGQGSNYTLTMKYGDGTLALVQFSALTPMILPSRINSKNIVSWMQVESGSVVNTFVSGQSYNIPARDITVNATNVSEDVAKITGVTAATSTSAVTGTNIRATLNGTTINLSGAIGQGVGDMSGITLNLTTDVIGTDGTPLVLTGVPVDFNPATKVTNFNAFWVPSNGARVENGQLVLANGTRYTVNGSGLAVSASNLKLAGGTYDIAVVVGGRMSSWLQPAKDELIDKLNGGSANFDINGNKAMLEAINAAQATITNTNTVTNWINTARSTVWTRGFADSSTATGYATNMTPHSGSYANAASDNADKTAITNAFADAYIVPYLQVNITDYDESGTLTATLTPYFRVDVSAAAGYNENVAYTVQAGRALSELTGDMSTPVKVTFNLPSAFQGMYMHQDGKYVYKATVNTWSIDHAGTTGLGTIQINSVDGLITLTQPESTDKFNGGKYDSLQAAVDDTIPEKTVGSSTKYSHIKVDSAFGGSCTFAMDGLARTIEIEILGNKEVSCSSNYVDKTNIDGANYIFQLRRDNVIAGDVAITVTENNNGTTTLSTKAARVGETVTVTVQPNQGNSVSSVTARTNTGENVLVTASTTNANQYTFIVPNGATSIVVTPVFKQGATQAVVNVSPSYQGSVTTTAAATENKVDTGSTVGVTTYPGSGYRTMGVNITTNGGATSANRVNDNYFTFTVPSNATTVTVTPVYDRDNGTKFTDVWSTEYYSNAVSWAVSRGITTGQSTYLFGSSNYCTRGEMVTFLYRAAGQPSVGNVRNPFVDVAPGDYFYNAVLWAVSQGITDGVDATHFGPKQYVTRAQAVTFLYRYEKSPAASTNNAFYDVSASDYFAKAVTWAANKGVTNGKTTTSFAPKDACKRCEIVSFLYRDVTGNRA